MPNAPTMPIEERFWSHVDKTPTCWLWTGSKDRQGYGTFGVGSRTDGTRRTVKAHRWAYERYVGPFPAGLEPDHLCRTPACVRPDHLEPVTHQENALRGLSALHPLACAAGHRLTPENTYFGPKGRVCRTCQRRNERAYRARKRGT